MAQVGPIVVRIEQTWASDLLFHLLLPLVLVGMPIQLAGKIVGRFYKVTVKAGP